MPPPPLLGFNNNVRHRGRIFHIQTEDSGVQRPRIVTHLFADGGRIIKTTRTDYSEHIGREDMTTVVRRLMKEQHKAMFIALRAGQLDDLLDQAGRRSELSSAEPPLRDVQAGLADPEFLADVSSDPPVGVEDPVSGPEASPASLKSTAPGRARRSRASVRPKQGAGRYAASRPASIFGDAPPAKSIFGEEIISEKSLDEVILSYLAEDLDDSADER